MFLILLLLLVSFHYNEAYIGMVVHTGMVMSCSNPQWRIEVKWKECIVSCAKNESCAVAQTYPIKFGLCYTCGIENIRSSESVDDYRYQIALKTSSKPQPLCDSFKMGQYTTYFNNTSGLTNNSYAIQLLKNVTRRCPTNWRLFNRELGDWCIKMYGGSVSQTKATEECAKYGAVLSGLETQNETNFLHDFGSKNLEGEFATVWVDGVRRKGCQTTGEKQFPPGCKSFDGFNFTDKLLSTKSGYKWEMNNPDGLKREGGSDYQDCLALWIKFKPNEKLIDDVFCDDQGVKGYVCGKEPGY
ncbi:hypothetical protein B9Z55_013740 [Caenorhabditis nigoni]|uniref:C-type lectin domain-containing protein n=1 Tax=Caenorhabditis nigoni TaxID=1611254 RepID=A0A2G5U399_9PELO|nr:hypothetical protein B9Z55_013740 [Caenorhabditis nigoni]